MFDRVHQKVFVVVAVFSAQRSLRSFSVIVTSTEIEPKLRQEALLVSPCVVSTVSTHHERSENAYCPPT